MPNTNSIRSRILKLFFFVLILQLNANSQSPVEMLNRWSARSPIEKAYLHLDRENYMAGETIWFKAYLYSEYLPDTASTTLYVELLDPSSTIILRKILPVFFGSAWGQLELEDTMKKGSYFIRAYTHTMLNHDPEFVYKRTIEIYGKTTPVSAPQILQKKISLEFFPEGGNLISGFMNSVAFKATNENGIPVDVQGIIKSDRKEVATTFSAYHDGMGFFDLDAKEDEKFYAVINGDTEEKKYYLPELVPKGIVFRIMPDPRGKYFEILQQTNDPAFQAAYMIGQMQHHVVFFHEFSKNIDLLKGAISTGNLNSGILQITVFNKNGMPLAERLSFIDNKEYIQPGELITDTLDFSERARNHFSISLKDTLTGNFSVSVTDPDYGGLPAREENIISRILLSSDLKGYVHNPSWYFSSTEDSVKNSLDLVMMTNGWRRFKWSSLLSEQLATGNYEDPGFITIKGKINIRGTRKPFAEKPFLIFLTGADSTQSIHMTQTDPYGYFSLDSLIFYDRNRILFKDIRGRKSDLLEVNVSSDSITRAYALPAMGKKAVINVDTSFTNKLAIEYDAILKADGKMLKGVVVKTRRKNPITELEEKYSSGLFSGFSQTTIDLINTNEQINHRNIFDYLEYRVPGLEISNNGFDYMVFYRQRSSISSLGAIPMVLYLDEIETDPSFIATIPANQIAMVKIYSSFVGAIGGGAGGALAVYTKKGTDLFERSSSDDQLKYRGYSITKEFYSPRYTGNPTVKTNADRRITLHWQPDIFVQGADIKIPIIFYNNDRSTRFKVVVEGMTTTGKMLLIEKTITGKGF